jgi:hypothetical protein
MNSIKYIKSWCKSKTSFYFFIPTDSEGKPFDNQYKVLDVIGGDDSIVLVMSEETRFTFFGKVQFRDEGVNLVFWGFERMVYENDKEETVCEDGEFSLSGF